MSEVQFVPQAEQRLATARQACDCDHVYGIVFACPATLLPRMGQMVLQRGDICDIPHVMPMRFECPRHVIMGW